MFLSAAPTSQLASSSVRGSPRTGRTNSLTGVTRTTNVSHQVLELSRVHGPTPVLVESSEGELHHFLVLARVVSDKSATGNIKLTNLCVTHLVRHQNTKLWELNFPRAVSVVLKIDGETRQLVTIHQTPVTIHQIRETIHQLLDTRYQT